MREKHFFEKKPKKSIESDEFLREKTISQVPVPDGAPAFKEGYRECLGMYALHAPNKRQVARILDEHCITLENECLREQMSRETLARYEGYRQAMKDLRRMRKIR